LIISGGVELSRRQLQIFEEKMDDEIMDRISEGEGLAYGDSSSQHVDNDVLKKEVDAHFVIGDSECSEKQYENFDDNAGDRKQKSAE
jgi:hypothetical protein